MKLNKFFALLAAGIPMIFLFSQVSMIQTEYAENERIDEKAREALSFCKANGYNTDFCIIKCTDWSRRTTMLSNALLCFIRIRLSLRSKHILFICPWDGVSAVRLQITRR